MTPHRLNEFSDGIFVISATLLILNFAVPVVAGNNNWQLELRLLGQWPKLLAFLLSFGVVINYWRLHSAMFREVKVIDHTTILLNTGLLAAAAFVPYATNVAGSYPTSPAAAVLYSAVLLTAAVVGFAMSRHLIACDAYGTARTPAHALATYRRIRLSILVRVTGLLFAFFFPIVSYLIYWVVIFYYLSFTIDKTVEAPL
jgi:uncharacterized membrane protein